MYNNLNLHHKHIKIIIRLNFNPFVINLFVQNHILYPIKSINLLYYITHIAIYHTYIYYYLLNYNIIKWFIEFNMDFLNLFYLIINYLYHLINLTNCNIMNYLSKCL